MKYYTLLFCLFLCGQATAQTEDFEDESVSSTSFTVDGIAFNMTGDFAITQFTNFSCGRGNVPNKYMDSGYQDGASIGVVGTIAPAVPGHTFMLSTTASQCGWTGENDGDNNFDATMRFTGTKVDNTTVSEDIFFDTSIPDVEMTAFMFSGAIWAGVDLKSLQFEIVGPAACNYFALDNLTFESILPVEWASFRALNNPKSVDLIWTTSSETANEKFVVEESQDGTTFQPIGVVAGNSITRASNDYTFEVEQPRIGSTYYRLKQVDFDGAYDYSNVIIVDFKGASFETVRVYPNPNRTGQINVNYVSEFSQELEVSIFDLTGKAIMHKEQSISSGSNDLTLDVSNLTPGIYLVKMGNEDSVVTRKVVIE